MMLTKHFLNILQRAVMMPDRFELTFQLHGFSRLSFAPCLPQKTAHEIWHLSIVETHVHYSLGKNSRNFENKGRCRKSNMNRYYKVVLNGSLSQSTYVLRQVNCSKTNSIFRAPWWTLHAETANVLTLDMWPCNLWMTLTSDPVNVTTLMNVSSLLVTQNREAPVERKYFTHVSSRPWRDSCEE